MTLFWKSKRETHWYQQEKLYNLYFQQILRCIVHSVIPFVILMHRTLQKQFLIESKAASWRILSLITQCLSTEGLASHLNFWDAVAALLKSGAHFHWWSWGQGSTCCWKKCFPECPESYVRARTEITVSERQISCLKFCILIQPPPLHMKCFHKGLSPDLDLIRSINLCIVRWKYTGHKQRYLMFGYVASRKYQNHIIIFFKTRRLLFLWLSLHSCAFYSTMHSLRLVFYSEKVNWEY